MAKKWLIRRQVLKAMDYQDIFNPDTKRIGTYKQSEKEALSRILPKNLSERKLKVWTKAVGA